MSVISSLVGKYQMIKCRKSVKLFIANFGGVDKLDMLRQLYGVNCKSMKLALTFFLDFLVRQLLVLIFHILLNHT